MIGILIVLILLLAFYSGNRRGTALQLVYSGGFFIAFLIAKKYYEQLGEKISLYVPYLSVSPDTKMVFFNQEKSFDLDKSFYAGLSFIGILMFVYLITKFIGILASALRYQQLIPSVDGLIAGMMNLMIAYVWIFLLFKLLTLIPIDSIQNLFKTGSIPRFIVEKSPFLADYFEKIWITQLIGS